MSVSADLRVYQVDRGYLSKESYYSIEPIRTSKGVLFLTMRSKPVVSGTSTLRNERFEAVDPHVIKVLKVLEEGLVVSRKTSSHEICMLGFDGTVLVPAARFPGIVPKRKHTLHDRIPVRGAGNAARLYGYMDASGKEVIPAKFRKVTLFSAHGRAAVMTEKGWGVIDRDGEYVVEPQFAGALCGDDPGFLTATADEIRLHDLSGEILFTAPGRFWLETVAPGRLLVTEFENKKPVRRFFYALK
jgi:hypothetical protein